MKPRPAAIPENFFRGLSIGAALARHGVGGA